MPTVITIKKLITPNKFNKANDLSVNNLPVVSFESLNIAEKSMINWVAKNNVDNVEKD